ncbi:hypothetical protein VMCG_00888 [Cytospora schulzeri]|uniref:Uncharacterized protein n=1 Tax=Cytospora schulzeri TaxID=448051 RepID=A0A423X5V9_9PEZI|nr:hypothetical protein VMCG_00888 [Valsa malicola]
MPPVKRKSVPQQTEEPHPQSSVKTRPLPKRSRLDEPSSVSSGHAERHLTPAEPRAGTQGSVEPDTAVEPDDCNSQTGDLTQCIISLDKSEVSGLLMTWCHIHRPLRDDIVRVSNHILQSTSVVSAEGETSGAGDPSFVQRITCLSDETAKGLLLCWAPSFEPLAAAVMNIISHKPTPTPQEGGPVSEPRAVVPEPRAGEKTTATTIDLTDDSRPEGVDTDNSSPTHDEHTNQPAGPPMPGTPAERTTDHDTENTDINSVELAADNCQELAKARDKLLAHDKNLDEELCSHEFGRFRGKDRVSESAAAILKQLDDSCEAIDRFMGSETSINREELSFYACAALLGMATAIMREAREHHGFRGPNALGRFRQPRPVDLLFEKFWSQVPPSLRTRCRQWRTRRGLSFEQECKLLVSVCVVRRMMPRLQMALRDIDEWEPPLPVLSQDKIDFNGQFRNFNDWLTEYWCTFDRKAQAPECAKRIMRLVFENLRWIFGAAMSQSSPQTRRDAVLAIVSITNNVVFSIGNSGIDEPSQLVKSLRWLFDHHGGFVADYIEGICSRMGQAEKYLLLVEDFGCPTWLITNDSERIDEVLRVYAFHSADGLKTLDSSDLIDRWVNPDSQTQT